MEVSLFEFFARGIPEASLFILAAYIFSNKKFDLRKIIISTLLLSISIYSIRKLPIQYGVNNILTIFAFIAIIVILNNIYLIISIKISIFIFMVQFICEGINIFILKYLFNYNLDYIFSDPKLKTIYGIPSIIIFGILLLVYYMISNRKAIGREKLDGKNIK